MKTKAFTLVELIIVITILAILGTISFISLQGYSKDTRDVKRISDVRSLLNKINIENTAGTPLSGLITNSEIATGQILGTPNTPFQTMGEVNFTNLNENSNDFQDPSNNEDYPVAYAVGGTGSGVYNFTQIATISEAQDTTKILGNYYTTTTNDIPSLFLKEGGNTTNPNDYYTENGETIYDVNNGSNNNNGGTTPPLIIPSCDETTKPTDNGNIIYTEGTPTSEIKSWQNTDSNNACYYTCKFNYTGINCDEEIYDYTNATTEEILSELPDTIYNNELPSDACIGCKDILIGDGSGSGYVMVDRNLGATAVYNGETEPKGMAGLNNPPAYRGNHYQWGRDIGFIVTNGTLNVAQPQIDPATRNDNTNFIWSGSLTRNDWSSSQEDHLWGDNTTSNGTITTGTSNQGPCPDGYHIPTTLEWDSIIKLWFENNNDTCTAGAGGFCNWGTETTITNFKKDLKLPLAGRRNWDNGTVYHQGANGHYWSSSPSGTRARYLYFYSNLMFPQLDLYRAYGFSIRCFKD